MKIILSSAGEIDAVWKNINVLYIHIRCPRIKNDMICNAY